MRCAVIFYADKCMSMKLIFFDFISSNAVKWENEKL